MGYSTTFMGEILIDPPLNEHEVSYLQEFSRSRRVKHKYGPYQVKVEGVFGEAPDANILNYNEPPATQPGLWCDWEPTDDGRAIVWNQSEKSYENENWVKYLIDHFLKPDAVVKKMGFVKKDPRFEHFTFDHSLNGRVLAQGEDPYDLWYLIVQDNKVSRAEAMMSMDLSWR